MTALAPTAPSSEGAPLTDVLVARQPIFDSRDEVFAYELLYRSADDAEDARGAVDAEGKTIDLIANTFLGIGIREITGRVPAFINFTQSQLTDELWRLFDPTLVGIEILESCELTPELLQCVQRMVAAGYRIALDDFRWSEESVPLLELKPIVKVDVLEQGPEAIEELVTRLLPYDVRLLAERVESQEVRDQCLALGFDLFQGHFYARPETVAKKEPAASQLAILRLLNLLRDPKVADAALDKAFGTDVNLTYKLLRMVNSAATGARGIESIGHAVRLLGRAPLHRWLSLLFVSSLAAEGGIKIELTQAALVRARLCELIATASSMSGARRDPNTAFMVGLFSVIDALLRMPMTEVLARIDLSTEVRSALLERQGSYAAPLFLAEAYEQGNWTAVRAQSKDQGINGQALAKMYLDSIAWSRQQMSLN